MTDLLSVTDVLRAVPRLTSGKLLAFVEARILVPREIDGGLRFGPADLARVELLCDLSADFDLDDEALGLMMSLLDQLYAARRELRAICEVLAEEPHDLRTRIGSRLARSG
jgi:chaperone modulatory protein CbpM